MTTPDLKILGIDPSISRTGWAIVDGAGGLGDFGVFASSAAKGTTADRTTVLCRNVIKLALSQCPDVIVVEVPSRHVWRRVAASGGAGLAIYGFAAGAVYATLQGDLAATWEMAEAVAGKWNGNEKKATRQQAMKAMFPSYRDTKDPGGDIADAIGLGLWWVNEQRMQRLLSAK